MKELTTDKPLVIGLVGLPGAGKSHFGREFGTMFGAPMVESDLLVRTILGGSIDGRDQLTNVKNAYFGFAGELFKTRRLFLLDGFTGTYGERSEIRAVAKKAGYETLWLWVQTSDAVALDRATKRKRGSTNRVMSQAEFAVLAGKFEAPRSNESQIALSGQRTFSSQVKPILMKLAEGHEAKLAVPRAADRPTRRNIFIR